MKVFNTLTRKKEELVPINEGEFKIYACGPTVYNYIHIGNARPLCVFDVLRRYLEYMGNKVTFVQNFTDIDDKIIRRANEEGVTYKDISEKYIEEFWVDAKGLNIREATVHPKATENIGEIISIVSSLVEKGFAYAVNGDVYFSTKKFKEYGKLVEINESSILWKNTRDNFREIMKICKKYEIPVLINTDAHFCGIVGDVTESEKLVDELDFPKRLILNADWDALREYFRNRKGGILD